MKSFEVIVKDKKDEEVQRVFVRANSRVKAERLAIIITADFYTEKTSIYTSISTICEESLNPQDFDIAVAIRKEALNKQEASDKPVPLSSL